MPLPFRSLLLSLILLGLPCLASLKAEPPASASASAFTNADILAAAKEQIGVTTSYDPSYVRLEYPGGDVPMDRGVCTDVVIRALRKVGVDLQPLIHEDMKAHFKKYPQLWGLKAPDPHIDHRRVPNIQTYLIRSGKSVSLKMDAANFLPGDIVTWKLPHGPPHIGIVSDKKQYYTNVPLTVHNIGFGTRESGTVMDWHITGHFRWFPTLPTLPTIPPQ